MSTSAKYRLADSTVVEPLVNHWAAFPSVVAPVFASLHLVHYQLKLLRSYLENPALHVKASSDPELTGGAFMGIPVERAGEVERLLAETERAQGANIELAGALIDFHNRLNAEADGLSLTRFYGSLPEQLRGYVELVYDYYNRPTVRFFEGLLYDSPYYNEKLQALRILKMRGEGDRAFVINTPRLPEPDQFNWEIPFADGRVDELFRLDSEPRELGHVLELLGAGAGERLAPMLSAEPRPLAEKWTEPTVRIRYFGHACLLLEWEGVSVLTDPCIGVMPESGGLDRFSYSDLPRFIDYVLVTHSHHDHFALETLLRLRHRIGCLVVPKSHGLLYGDVSLKVMCRRLGFKNVLEVDALDSIPLPGGEIFAIPFLGEHGDLAHAKSAYVVRARGQQIMVAADSDCLDRRLYEHIRESIGAVQTVFLGTESVGAPLSWIYGPLLPKAPHREQDETRRQHGSDSESALAILEAVGAQRLYNYAMGLEPWMECVLGLGLHTDAPQWRESCRLLAKARRRGLLIAERPYGKLEIFLENARGARPAVSSAETGRRARREVAIGRRGASGETPLSPAQAVLLRETERDPAGATNAVASVAFDGQLDLSRLTQSLGEVLRRHEVLRTRFHVVDGTATAALSDEASVPLEIVDLSGEDDRQSAIERETRRLERAERDRGSLARPRAVLLQFSRELNVLLFSADRAVFDSRSASLLLEELAEGLAAAGGESTAPPELPFQYSDFAAWQRERHASAEGRRQLSYWKELFEDGWPTSSPFGKGEADQLDARGKEVARAEVPPEAIAALEELAGAGRCPRAVVLLAALQVLLQRQTGAEDVPAALLIDNRSSYGAERLIGPFEQAAPVYTDFSGRPSTLDLLSRTREAAERARENLDLPFEVVRESLDGGTGRAASFPLLVDLGRPPAGLPAGEGVTAALLDYPRVSPRHPLVVYFVERDGGAALEMEYDRGLVSDEKAAPLLGQLSALLKGMAASPRLPVAEVRLAADAAAGGDAEPPARTMSDPAAEFVF